MKSLPFYINKNYFCFFMSRFLSLMAYQIFVISISQYIFEITRSPLHLGFIGLSLFLPKMVTALFAGHAADHHSRKKIMMLARLTLLVVSVILFGAIYFNASSLLLIYILLVCIGIANAYDGPATSASVPSLVKKEEFAHAVTWASTAVQMAFIAGPAFCGLLYLWEFNFLEILSVVIGIRVLALTFLFFLRLAPTLKRSTEISIDSLITGLHFVFKEKRLLGLISLDLFAVLFGGAVSLMPIYANEILKMGPEGLGWMRMAPAVGGVFISLFLSPQKEGRFYKYTKSLWENSGSLMFAAVGVFGLTTILFGISTSFVWSLVLLFILGASDMISVVIRSVMVQSLTPDEMRGRVSAVNLIFIGASNELGEFESGITAEWFGTRPATILGGGLTLAVVVLWRKLFPQILHIKSLHQKEDAPLIDQPEQNKTVAQD